MFIIKIIYAIIFILMGFAIIKYRRNVKSWTGNFMWAESYIGNGGTYLVLILIGAILVFYGVIYPFGGADLFLRK